jgi:hypothetical protein
MMMTLYRQRACVYDGWDTIQIVAFNYDGKGAALAICNGIDVIGFAPADLEMILFGCVDDNPFKRYYSIKPKRKRKP